MLPPWKKRRMYSIEDRAFGVVLFVKALIAVLVGSRGCQVNVGQPCDFLDSKYVVKLRNRALDV